MSSKKSKYSLPIEQTYAPDAERYFSNPPNLKYWVHGEQTDDVLDADAIRRTKQIAELKKIKCAVQRSTQWYEERNGMITASAIGTAIKKNHYEPQYNLILGKLTVVPFNGEVACYHGKKMETISTMIYQYRMNVTVKEYGCIRHSCGFLGASPDGIVDVYKLDGIHKTNLVGTMLEIKNVTTRKINMTSNNTMDIVPEYYFPQVIMQLEACKLDVCHFWQTNIQEYKNREEFLEDTDPKEPFRSKKYGNEKGVLIELLPFGDIDNKGYMNMIYNHSKHIYPPRIEMSPYDCDQWVASTISNYRTTYPDFKDYVVDKTIYWYLKESRNVVVKRDSKLFEQKYIPVLEKLWYYITFLRNKENEKQKKLFLDYVKMIEEKYPGKYEGDKRNDFIMKMVDVLCNSKLKSYKKFLCDTQEELDRYNGQDDEIEKSTGGDNDFFGFNVC